LFDYRQHFVGKFFSTIKQDISKLSDMSDMITGVKIRGS